MTADVLAEEFVSATHMRGHVDSAASNLRSGLTYLFGTRLSCRHRC